MRTRFQSIDCFTSASTGALDFLQLPLPHLPPCNLSTSYDLRCFDDLSVYSIPLEIENLPIVEPLAKFFNDVLPQLVDVEIDDFSDAQSFYRTYHLDNERNVIEVRAREEEYETTTNAMGDLGPAMVEFEMPEMDQSMENSYLFHKENVGFFCEVSDVELNMDMLDHNLSMQQIFKIQKSIYSVDDIRLKDCIEQKDHLLEDVGSVQEQIYLSHTMFPVLEVDETSLEIFSGIFLDAKLLLLGNIEPQHGMHNYDVMSDCKELLGSSKFDIVELISEHFIFRESLEAQLSCLKFVRELDLISVIELSHIEGYSTLNLSMSHDDYVWPENTIQFEEFQFLECDSSQILELLFNSTLLNGTETFDCMIEEAKSFMNYDELIVSHELTLVDSYFKSLPVPIFSDHKKIRSLHLYVEEALAELKLQSHSASDDIYLDWHIMEEDNYSYSKHCSCWKMVEEIDTYSCDSELCSIDDGIVVFHFIFSDDNPDRVIAEENKEILHVHLGEFSSIPVCINEAASTKMQNDGSDESVRRDESSNIKVSLLVDPMPQFNDLDFFLNPLESTIGKCRKPDGKEIGISTAIPDYALRAPNILTLQKWDVKLHEIKLSDNILSLLDKFGKSFLAILENDAEMRKTPYPFLAVDEFTLFSLPRENLMDHIKKAYMQETLLAQGDDYVLAFVKLQAIKLMSWYLCYYGVHSAHLYVDVLSERLHGLKSKLSFLQNFFQDVLEKANKDIFKSHPSISVFHEILRSNIRQGSLKVLVVADKVFWSALKRLLTLMAISYFEFNDDAMDAVICSDCCLASHEKISKLFPFDKFGVILEYGGPCDSSRVSTISLKLNYFPVLHFLKVDLENSSIAKALCKNVDLLKNTGFGMERDVDAVFPLNESDQMLEQLLNFRAVWKKNKAGSLETADVVKLSSMPLPVSCVPLASETNEICTSMNSFPDTIIIVNTQNFERELIISRRSTYQRILAIEKEGTQVVERDVNMPVDVVLSSAVCLAWYDCTNIGKKATTPNEASSSLHQSVENIAGNVLTSLSFGFTGCFLVFEGEISFIAAIMESADELYAAATSLGIDLQLFCSYSSEMTDEIILSCIAYATRFTEGIYAKMPESETLAESFLTTFPSINPLSAHAILSSGGMLVEFLAWSPEHRISAVQKYYVPDESIALLSALCRYGERDDCKSGTTDCSSVSSAPDSDRCHKNNSKRNKRKYIEIPNCIEIPEEELFQFDQLYQQTENKKNLRRPSEPSNSWILEGLDLLDEVGKPIEPFNDKLFSQLQRLDNNMTKNLSGASNRYDFQVSKGPEKSGQSQQSRRHTGTKMFGQNQGLDRGIKKKLNMDNFNSSGIQPEDFVGEVIDVEDGSPLNKDFSSIKSFAFPPLSHAMRKDASGFSESARKTFGASSLPTFPTSAELNSDSDPWDSTRDHEQSMTKEINPLSDAYFPPLSHAMRKEDASGFSESARKTFGASSLPTFPTAAELNSDSDPWDSTRDHEQSMTKEINQLSDAYFQHDNMRSELPRKRLEVDGVIETAKNSYKSSLPEKDVPRYSGTPLSYAICSTQLQKGSPWTTEFLNKIREKSRLRQQSVSPELSALCSGCLQDLSKVNKRKSPSIIDFYKYQGSSTSKKIMEQKRPKRSSRSSSSSKIEKTLTSFATTWTPVDKRARQTLSFATNGSGGQSKLVWSDKNAYTVKRRI